MKKENASIVFETVNMTGRLTIADLVVADAKGKILYSMANDTSLYGVGDIKNVDGNVSKWSANTDSGVAYPIITRGDARDGSARYAQPPPHGNVARDRPHCWFPVQW